MSSTVKSGPSLNQCLLVFPFFQSSLLVAISASVSGSSLSCIVGLAIAEATSASLATIFAASSGLSLISFFLTVIFFLIISTLSGPRISSATNLANLNVVVALATCSLIFGTSTNRCIVSLSLVSKAYSDKLSLCKNA